MPAGLEWEGVPKLGRGEDEDTASIAAAPAAASYSRMNWLANTGGRTSGSLIAGEGGTSIEVELEAAAAE